MTENVERFLQEVQREASAKFPGVGLLLFAVVDDEFHDETSSIICVTNMDDDDVESVLDGATALDFETTAVIDKGMLQ